MNGVLSGLYSENHMNHALTNLLLNIVALSIGMKIANAFIPMPMVIKSLLNLVVVVVMILFVLQYVGVINTIVPMFSIAR